MLQIVQNVRTGKVQQKQVPTPACGAGEVLVQTRASLISAGTEKMVMEFAGKSLLGKAQERPDLVKKVLQKVQRDGVVEALTSAFGKLDEPLPLGYSAAGIVVQVGANLTAEFKVGDRVAIAGAGLANHAEYCAVPRNLVVKLPQNVAFNEGCYATLAAIALHGVRNAEVTLGSRVLVLGLGLVGQLAVQLAAAAGARVAATDMQPARIMLAKQGGATWAVGPKGLNEGWQQFTDGRGFDAILLCAATASDALLQQAAEMARDRARVILVGKVGTRFDYASYMKKELTLRVSRSYGPGRYDPAYEAKGETYPAGYIPFTERDNLADAVRLMGEGKLKPALLTTHTYPFTEALQGYALISSKHTEGTLGVVLAYAEQAEKAPRVIQSEAKDPGLATQTLGVSFLGVGAFARGVLLPKLAKINGVSLQGVISKGGLSAAHVQEKFGAAWADTSMQRVLADTATQAVIIATRHNAHAAQVVQALKAGKHVWIEKPLALNAVELGNIEREVTKRPAQVLMVGFNRRFAPALMPLQQKLSVITGPKQVLIRVNAGLVEGWVQSDEGGGRLLGEMCHFTDLAGWLVGGDVQNVQVTRGQGQDTYSITLSFTGGSLAQILYTSEGDPAAPKEFIEAFGGGGYGRMENYTRTTWQQRGCRQTLYKKHFWQGQDKGHAGALAAWVAACQGGVNALPTAAELIASSRLILQIQDKLTQ